MSVDVIRKAFQATEEGFMSLVSQLWPISPQIAAVGSCCLVGVICNGTLYIANLGDSRAVLGRTVKATGEVLAMQLSTEHNASIESIRQELHSLHPDDSNIVVLKHNVWRVKGIIQVSHGQILLWHVRDSLGTITEFLLSFVAIIAIYLILVSFYMSENTDSFGCVFLFFYCRYLDVLAMYI